MWESLNVASGNPLLPPETRLPHGDMYCLIGGAMSTARVAVVMRELDLVYTYVPLDFSKDEHKAPAYLAFQPFGKVPVLKEERFVIYESRAICKYLAKKWGYGSGLLPLHDDKAYARFEQACSMEQSYFAAAAETIGWELFIKERKGLDGPDLAAVARAEAFLDKTLSVYNDILAKQKYLAGDALTLADLFHLPNGAALIHGQWGENFKKYEHVYKWFTELQSRDTWQHAARQTSSQP